MRSLVFRPKFSTVLNGGLGSIEWCPRTPDLSPMDFFLGPLKSEVCGTQPTNLEELYQPILDELFENSFIIVWTLKTITFNISSTKKYVTS